MSVKQFSKLAHHEDLRRQISEIKQSMPKLDFGVYRQTLPKEMAKIVDEAETQFKSLQTTQN